MRHIFFAILMICLPGLAVAGDPPAEPASLAEGCATPVYMVVIGNVLDAEVMAAYGQALRESGLYPTTQGYYEAYGDPVEIFEGDWQQSQFLVFVRFPCIQAARDFWFSEKYEEIKKMREGSATVFSGVFPELPTPAYVHWDFEPPQPQAAE